MKLLSLMSFVFVLATSVVFDVNADSASKTESITGKTNSKPNNPVEYSTEKWIDLPQYKVPGTQPKQLTADLTPKAIVTAANQVADWQLAQYDIGSNQMRVEDRSSALPEGWIYATLHIGMLAWGETVKNERYIQAVRNISAVNSWKLGPRFYHADDHAAGQVYLDLYRRYGDKNMIANVQQTFDWVLANPSDRSLDFNAHPQEKFTTANRKFSDPWCGQRWCWADALFMAPPVWAQLTKVTGDKRYLEFMDKEFWAATDYLYNKKDKLYLRDSRFFTKKDDNGNHVYWGRGNGWVLAGIARILSYLPEDFPKRKEYLQLYRELSKRISQVQNSDGSWPTSLMGKEDFPHPESSGTGLLVFGLAWGVNNGYLDQKTYLPVIEKGWQSLINSTEDTGRVGWVQQVGYEPGSAHKEDIQLYGPGAFLLAASEVYKIAEKNVSKNDAAKSDVLKKK